VDHWHHPLVSLQVQVEFLDQEVVPHELVFERCMVLQLVVLRWLELGGVSVFKRLNDVRWLRVMVRVDIVCVQL